MIAQTIAELLQVHVTLTLEGIDRLYLNAYTYFPFECPGAHIRDAGAASVARGPVGLVHRSNLDSPLY